MKLKSLALLATVLCVLALPAMSATITWDLNGFDPTTVGGTTAGFSGPVTNGAATITGSASFACLDNAGVCGLNGNGVGGWGVVGGVSNIRIDDSETVTVTFGANVNNVSIIVDALAIAESADWSSTPTSGSTPGYCCGGEERITLFSGVNFLSGQAVTISVGSGSFTLREIDWDTIDAVPEPATFGLLGLGLSALGLVARRRRSA